MDIEQILDVVEYGIKYYKDDELNVRFSLYDYYSITDISPKDLADLALINRNTNACRVIRGFDARQHWNQKQVDMSKRLILYHAINNKELTADDKLSIMGRLVQEGFPAIEGIYDIACRYYVAGGIDKISKEDTKNKVLESYISKTGTSYNNEISGNAKVKTLKL